MLPRPEAEKLILCLFYASRYDFQKWSDLLDERFQVRISPIDLEEMYYQDVYERIEYELCRTPSP